MKKLDLWEERTKNTLEYMKDELDEESREICGAILLLVSIVRKQRDAIEWAIGESDEAQVVAYLESSFKEVEEMLK